MPLKKAITQVGDTIIEVMISIAIIGAVLAAAYATANRSQNAVRDAQEHEEATTLAESQFEILNDTSAIQLASAPTNFCFTSSATPTIADSATVNGPCYNQGSDKLYHVTITEEAANTSPNLPTYEITIDWPSLSGGTDTVQMYYQPPSD